MQTNQNPKKDLKGKKILIVEDEDSNFKFLEMVLIKINAEIIRAKTGEEAYQLYKTSHIDMILMDIKLPLTDGLLVTKRIRETDSKIPIIAQTAYAMLNDRNKCIDAGCNDYISKPINKLRLLELIYKYIS